MLILPTIVLPTALAIGSGVAALGGAIGSAIKNKKGRNLLSGLEEDNKKWYEMKKSEDYTMRSDAQALLSKQRELYLEGLRNARQTNQVAGGSEESLAAQKEAVNKSVADSTAQIASEASAYKDNVDQQYRTQQAALTQQQAALAQQQAQNIAQAAGQAASAGVNLAGAMGNIPTAPKETQAPVGKDQLEAAKKQSANPSWPIPPATPIDKKNN